MCFAYNSILSVSAVGSVAIYGKSHLLVCVLLFKCLVILSLEQVFQLPLSPGVHHQTGWCSLDSLYSSPILPLEFHPQPTSGSRTSSPSPLPPRSLWTVHQEGCTLEPLMAPMQGGTRAGRPMRLQEWG